MFRKVFSYLICTALVLQIGSKTFIYAGYIFDQERISETVCINKDKPSLHCHGSCFLKNELNKEDQRENQHGNLLKEKFDHFYNDPTRFKVLTAVYSITNSPDLKPEFADGHPGNVFQPPKIKAGYMC
ncbi:MAG: hypothetical protein IPQ03_06330 [Bacteroidetes bacterium]|nr:hypothetical protein [Bacteroidota bacterium]